MSTTKCKLQNPIQKIVAEAGRIDEYLPIHEARNGTSSLPYGNGYASRKFTSLPASMPSFLPVPSTSCTLGRFQPPSECCTSLLRAKLYNRVPRYCVRKKKEEKEARERNTYAHSGARIWVWGERERERKKGEIREKGNVSKVERLK